MNLFIYHRLIREYPMIKVQRRDPNRPFFFRPKPTSFLMCLKRTEQENASERCPFTNKNDEKTMPHTEKNQQIDIFISNLEKIHRYEIKLESENKKIVNNLDELRSVLTEEELQLLKKEKSLLVCEPIIKKIIEGLNFQLSLIESLLDGEHMNEESKMSERQRYCKKIASYERLLENARGNCQSQVQFKIR